jgi:outer membrane lipopolysaccharide assembly protein LptE/RlpB
MRAAKLSVILLLIGLLTACGFKLRGSAELPGYTLPFTTIALSLAPTSEFYALLKRNIEASSPGTRVVADSKDAEAILSVLGDSTEKVILSLNAAGRAREFQLVRRFSFKVHANVPGGTATLPVVPSTPMRRHWLVRPNTSRPAPSHCAAKSPSVTTGAVQGIGRSSCCCATCRATWCSN